MACPIFACFGQLALVTSLTLEELKINVSTPDSFRQGTKIHIGLDVHPHCAVQAIMAYLLQWGNAPGPLFMLEDGRPRLSRAPLTVIAGMDTPKYGETLRDT